MTSPTTIQVWGGPLDGQEMPYYGRRMRALRPRRHDVFLAADTPPLVPDLDDRVDDYVLVYDMDMCPFYVLADMVARMG